MHGATITLSAAVHLRNDRESGSEIETVTTKLFSGQFTHKDLEDLVLGRSEEAIARAEFSQRYPEVSDEMALRVVPTALHVAKKQRLILVSDDPGMDVPRYSRSDATVRQLTGVLADEAVRIALPRCAELSPEAILEARERLRDELIPFRMYMQRLTAELRSQLSEDMALADVWKEARFLVESTVEPALHDLLAKVAQSEDRFLKKVFGTVVSWIPAVAKAFVTPSPESIYTAMNKAYEDVEELATAERDMVYARERGLSFLLDINKVLQRS